MSWTLYDQILGSDNNNKFHSDYYLIKLYIIYPTAFGLFFVDS